MLSLMYMFISKLENKIVFDNNTVGMFYNLRKSKTFQAHTRIHNATNLHTYIHTQKHTAIHTPRTHILRHTFTRTCTLTYTPLLFRYDEAITSISIMDISPCYKTGSKPANVYVPKFLQMREVLLDR